MIEIVEHDDKGIVEEMGTNVDQHGAREIEQIAEEHAQYETGYKSVDVAMSEGEDECRDNNSQMAVAKPMAENLLQGSAKEELFAHGRYQRHDKSLEQEVADGGE